MARVAIIDAGAERRDQDRRFSAHSKVYFGAVTDSPEVSLIRRINTVKYI